jgi:hypothetical protein
MWFFQLKIDGTIIRTDAGAARIFGFDRPQEIIGLNAEQFIHISNYSVLDMSIPGILQRVLDERPIFNLSGYFVGNSKKTRFPASFTFSLSQNKLYPVFNCIGVPASEAIKNSSQVCEELLSLVIMIDKSVSAHQDRVASLTSRIGESISMKAANQAILARAARLHDIGKLFVPGDIIQKPSSLSQTGAFHASACRVCQRFFGGLSGPGRGSVTHISPSRAMEWRRLPVWHKRGQHSSGSQDHRHF